jgi:hypothetical protein
MTFEPQASLPSSMSTTRPSRVSAWKPLLWLIAAAAMAVTTLMFAPVPPL